MDNQTQTKKQSISLIARRAPYGSGAARQTLDIAFAAAVFERPLNYIFIGDGVYQLLSKQDPEAIKNKPHGAALETLELYGIDEVYAHRNSLLQRALSEDELVCKVTLIDDCTLKKLVAESIHVINL